VAFIKDFFDKNSDIGMLYLCDQKGDLARHRRIIFGKWNRDIDIDAFYRNLDEFLGEDY
jgi:hypothetical protein